MDNLYKRYNKMEEQAGENGVGMDFREAVCDSFSKALKEDRGDMTLAELLDEIEEWYKIF